VIAIDGKTLRGSAHKKGAKAAIHMVSAFAARQRLVLWQVKVADKSNEIVAIPALLDMMVIEGAIVTIDATGPDAPRHRAERTRTRRTRKRVLPDPRPPRRHAGRRSASVTAFPQRTLPFPRSNQRRGLSGNAMLTCG
jgi:Transposase DDE domain